MANDISSNVSTVTLKKFLPSFMANQVVTKSVNRQLVQGEINPSTGDTVFVKRPHQWEPERTPDGDVSSSTKNQITSGKAATTVQDYITVRIEYSQLEEAIELNQLDKILEPVAKRMTDENEKSLVKFMIDNSSLFLGTAGTQVAAWSDVAQTFTHMNAVGVPNGNQFAVMNPWAVQNLADAQTGLFNESLVKTAWEEAVITRNFGGGIAFRSNNLRSHTVGAHADNALTVTSANSGVTYPSVKDTMQQTISITGFPTGTADVLLAGDVLQFDTVLLVNQQVKEAIFDDTGSTKKFTATVVNDVASDGGGIGIVTITAPIIDDAVNPQYNTVVAEPGIGDSVTVVSGATGAVNQPNLFYHRDAFTMATVQLPKLAAKESSIVNNEGFSIRVHRYSDGDANRQMVRFDMLPAYGAMNPLMAGKFFGNP